MLRKVVIGLVLLIAAGCGTFRGGPAPMAPAAVQAPLPPDRYVVFFTPRTSDLAAEAQTIVRQAAAAAKIRKASRIDIAVPARVPGGPNIVESRYTAIQNIISATGADPGLYSRVELSSGALALPGGVDRCEIRLIP